jgi:ribosomal protein L34E
VTARSLLRELVHRHHGAVLRVRLHRDAKAATRSSCDTNDSACHGALQRRPTQSAQVSSFQQRPTQARAARRFGGDAARVFRIRFALWREGTGGSWVVSAGMCAYLPPQPPRLHARTANSSYLRRHPRLYYADGATTTPAGPHQVRLHRISCGERGVRCRLQDSFVELIVPIWLRIGGPRPLGEPRLSGAKVLAHGAAKFRNDPMRRALATAVAEATREDEGFVFAARPRALATAVAEPRGRMRAWCSRHGRVRRPRTATTRIRG